LQAVAARPPAAPPWGGARTTPGPTLGECSTG
jgi:hypothetical protein